MLLGSFSLQYSSAYQTYGTNIIVSPAPLMESEAYSTTDYVVKYANPNFMGRKQKHFYLDFLRSLKTHPINGAQNYDYIIISLVSDGVN